MSCHDMTVVPSSCENLVASLCAADEPSDTAILELCVINVVS